MASDFLYTLPPPAGNVAEIGKASVAANDTYHVVGREYRGYQSVSSFVGEVQVYDANTGNLLRTIENPEPELGFHFGESVDVFGNLLVVGTTGRGVDPEEEFPEGDFADPTGKAYLYNLATGGLVYTFEQSYAPDVLFDPELDKFGASVAIFGDYVAVGAPGKAPDDTADENDGHVFVFSASSGTLLYTLENPGPYDGGDFGLYLALYDTKLVVSDPKHTSGNFGEGSGIVYVYDVTDGQLETTLTRPSDLDLSQFGEGIDIYENRVVVGNLVGNQIFAASGFITFDATTGAVQQKVITDVNTGDQLVMPTISENVIAARLLRYQASDLNRPAAQLFNATTGEWLDTITTPNASPLLTTGNITVFEDRLLISQYAPNFSAEHSNVHVYSHDIVIGNPPTDLVLSGNTVVEHSPNGTIIGSFTATDPDSGDTFTYSLTDTAGGRFAISGSNLVVDQSAVVNFETNPSPSVTVLVTDSSGKTYSEAFVIQITNINDTPTNITLSNNQVVENATNNIPIGAFQGVDEDAGETFSYTLVSNSNGRFGLNGSILVVADGSLLDFEQNTQHAIVVQVADAAGNTFSRSFTIQVLNVSDSAPTDIVLTNQRVVEHAKSGTLVASFESSIPEKYGFGQALAGGGDFLIAGETFAPGGGRVLMLNAADGSVIRTLVNPTPANDAQFGKVVAATSQYIVTSNPKNDDDGNLAGKVYVYSAASGQLLHAISSPAPAAFQEFGRNVAIDGDRLVVQSLLANGFVLRIFDASSGAFQTPIVKPIGASPFFGSQFKIVGNLLAISDQGYEINGVNVGRVFVFNATTGSLVQEIGNPEPSQQSGSNGDLFGASLGMAAGRLVVGAPGQDSGETDAGAIYAFNILTGDLMQTVVSPNPVASGSLGFRLVVSMDRIASTESVQSPNVIQGGRVQLFDLNSGALIASLTESPPQSNAFYGNAMAFVGEDLFVGSSSLYGQVEVFRQLDGERREGLRAVDPDIGDTFTFQLLDDAGGRFGLAGNHLVVANSLLLNYEEANVHTVVVQVTDSTGLSYQKTIPIELLDTQESAPTNLLLTDRFIPENAADGMRVSLIDNPTPYIGESFGEAIQYQPIYSMVLASDPLDQSTTNRTGSVHVIEASGGSLVRTLQNPNPTNGESFGASFASSSQYMVVGDPKEDDQAIDSGRAYLFDATDGSLLATFSHPNPGANHQFGSSVAMNSPWIAIGSENDGVVFVYSGGSGPIHELGSHIPGFGAEVLVTANRVIVGSPLEGNGGRVYIYDVITGNLLSVRDNPNPGGTGGMTDRFGSALALYSNQILVGAPGEDLAAEDAGAAYLLNIDDANSPLKTFVNPNPTVNERLGSTLAIDLFRLAVGLGIESSQILLFDAISGEYVDTVNADAGQQIGGFSLWDGQLRYTSRDMGATAGSQSVHVVDALNLRPRSAFQPIDADPDDTFTYTLLDDAGGRFALQGDQIVVANGSLLNFDLASSHTIVVQVTDSSGLSLIQSLIIQVRDVYEPSAPTDIGLGNNQVSEGDSRVIQNPFATAASDAMFARQTKVGGDFIAANYGSDSVPGTLMLFHRLTGEVLHELVNPFPNQGDRFGASVGISGDRVLVGAPQSSHLGLFSGEAYLFDAKSGDLLRVLTNPTPAGSSDRFGASVSMDGSLIAVSNETQSTGRVELFDANTGQHLLTLTGPDANSFFGQSVVVQGDRILVGASKFSGNGVGVGRAYLYQYDSANQSATLLMTLDNPTGGDFDEFGFRVAMQGNRMAISAPIYSTSSMILGRVYLFDLLSGNLLHTIENPAPGAFDFFGEAIAMDGDRLLVGAFADSNLGNSAGQAYVFDANTGSLISSLGMPVAGDFYGDAVGLDGSLHLVSSPGDDSDGLNRGRLFLYRFDSGSVVGSFSAVDANSSDTFTYSLVDSAGGRFGIQGSNLIVANGGLLDFEANAMHEIEVQVTDSSGLSFTETLVIEVMDVLDSGFDFGDLPASFGTTLASDGARHAIVPGYYLGSGNSAELDGQANAGASLDASDDGVTLPAFLVPGLDASIEVLASSYGRVDAFIDYSGDGVFTESERITPMAGQVVFSGSNTLSFGVPTTAQAGNRGIRVRFSTQGGLGPAGPATSGEVEDSWVSVVIPANNSSSLLPDPANFGNSMVYVKGTAVADTLIVTAWGNGLIANINGTLGPILSGASRIVIFGLGGDDQIWINNTSVPGYIDGGNGNDILRGGSGPDRLLGRSGNDSLYGRAGDDTLYGHSGNDALYSNGGVGMLLGGSEDDLLEGNGVLVGGTGADTLLGLGARNLLIGGRGADSITGANVDQGDILIAGFTSYDEEETGLSLLREEWKRNATIQSRIDHLDGMESGGLNGIRRLNTATVFKELGADTITNFGGSTPNRNDWVFLSDGDMQTNAVGIVVLIGDPPANVPAPSLSSVGGGMNFDLPFDVNQDGKVTPLDALQVLNRLNQATDGANGIESSEGFLDVNGDGRLSPLDALQVINRLNLGVGFRPDGEGEGAFDDGDHSERALYDSALAIVLEEGILRAKRRILAV